MLGYIKLYFRHERAFFGDCIGPNASPFMPLGHGDAPEPLGNAAENKQ